MNKDGDGAEWRPWQILSLLAGGAVSVPIVAGYVTLGAAVVLGRSIRDVAREVWEHVPPHLRGGNGGTGYRP